MIIKFHLFNNPHPDAKYIYLVMACLRTHYVAKYSYEQVLLSIANKSSIW